ncbi:MAG: serine/threonine-protein kinase, partial [Planctomycetota bacterium JB042]
MEPGSDADRLFAELVARGEGVTDESVQALCDGRPELAAEFRRLFDDWRRLQPFFERLDAERAVQAAVRASLATTRPDPAKPGAPSGDPLVDEIVRRLLERGPAVSRYRIDEEFARGGMGRIRRVFDQDLRRNLAMKVILEELDLRDSSTRRSDADERRLARFLEEAQIAGQLDHPGIAPVHELGLDADGHLYFTMKLVKGRTLLETYDLVRTGEGGWSVTRAVAALQKVCEAMAYAHEKGVLHRDLKPSNVMVGRFGEVYVMDWGLARVLGRADRKDIRLRERNDPPPSVVETERHTRKGGRPDSPLYTMDGDVVGTPAYMSPEQARGDLDDVGPQTDVYGVGAMLYHLLAERMPYASPDAPADAYEVLDRLRAGPPRPLHTVAAGTVPAELLSICEKAMARRRADRYATMTELADDLRAYLEDRVVRAHRTGPFAELSKWCVRNRPLAASLAALVVAVVGGALLFAWSESDKRTRLTTAFAETDAERAAKTRLSDVMTARFLRGDF